MKFQSFDWIRNAMLDEGSVTESQVNYNFLEEAS